MTKNVRAIGSIFNLFVRTGRGRPIRFVPGLMGMICFLSVAHGQGKAGEGEKLPGMAEEISVLPAKSLGISAASGEMVAVLDQSWVSEDPAASQVQDHHNGWLTLDAEKFDKNTLSVKGKYYVPTDAKKQADGLRVTLRKQSPEGLALLAEKTIKIEGVGMWVDFEEDFEIDPAAEGLDARKIILMFSAMDLAGPLYLDNVEALDVNGNNFWPSPEFE